MLCLVRDRRDRLPRGTQLVSWDGSNLNILSSLVYGNQLSLRPACLGARQPGVHIWCWLGKIELQTTRPVRGLCPAVGTHGREPLQTARQPRPELVNCWGPDPPGAQSHRPYVVWLEAAAGSPGSNLCMV